MFTLKDYAFWSRMLFTDSYPGYRKAGFEQPDAGTGSLYEYAHLAPKYLDEWRDCEYQDKPGADIRQLAYAMLHSLLTDAQEEAFSLGIPPDFHPVMEDSTLRLLRYPPGAESMPHTDFCLFTFPLWRNTWEPYKADLEHKKGLHIGEIMEKLLGTPATTHSVRPHTRWQFSAAYFAMPALNAILPTGEPVKDWLDVRKAETRSPEPQNVQG